MYGFGQFQAIKVILLNVELGRDIHSILFHSISTLQIQRIQVILNSTDNK
jgi:hypothetical protein